MAIINGTGLLFFGLVSIGAGSSIPLPGSASDFTGGGSLIVEGLAFSLLDGLGGGVGSGGKGDSLAGGGAGLVVAACLGGGVGSVWDGLGGGVGSLA